jgi:hypothetical protein
MTDLTKAPDQVIIDLINADNTPLALTAELVTFGVPNAAAGENPTKNTELTVTAAEGSGYSGSVVVTYNRVNLATIPTIAAAPAEFPLGNATTLKDLIPEFNAKYGVNLTDDDFVDAPIPEFTGGLNEEHTIQLVAKADSLIYIGSVDIVVQGEDIPLGSVVTNTALNGLVYEAPVAP